MTEQEWLEYLELQMQIADADDRERQLVKRSQELRKKRGEQ